MKAAQAAEHHVAQRRPHLARARITAGMSSVRARSSAITPSTSHGTSMSSTGRAKDTTEHLSMRLSLAQNATLANLAETRLQHLQCVVLQDGTRRKTDASVVLARSSHSAPLLVNHGRRQIPRLVTAEWIPRRPRRSARTAAKAPGASWGLRGAAHTVSRRLDLRQGPRQCGCSSSRTRRRDSRRRCRAAP